MCIRDGRGIIIITIIISGPKRYDVIDGRWRYSHDGTALHDLLSTEFSDTLGTTIDLSHLKYSHVSIDNGWA